MPTIASDRGPVSRQVSLTTSWQEFVLPDWCTGITPHNCSVIMHIVMPPDVGDPGDDPASGTPDKSVVLAAGASLYIPLRTALVATTAANPQRVLIAAASGTPTANLLLSGG